MKGRGRSRGSRTTRGGSCACPSHADPVTSLDVRLVGKSCGPLSCVHGESPGALTLCAPQFASFSAITVFTGNLIIWVLMALASPLVLMTAFTSQHVLEICLCSLWLSPLSAAQAHNPGGGGLYMNALDLSALHPLREPEEGWTEKTGARGEHKG